MRGVSPGKVYTELHARLLYGGEEKWAAHLQLLWFNTPSGGLVST